MDIKYSVSETEKIADLVLSKVSINTNRATVVGLSGELGAGKTTLVQAIAKKLNIAEAVVSPTFVIAKFYPIKNNDWKKLIHIDAYRLENSKEMEIIGWSDFLKEEGSLIIVEWPELVGDILPNDVKIFLIEQEGDNMRHIKLSL